MSRSEEFGYYYGVEAEQYSFYRVPRLLIKDERFKGLSSDAKLLYGLMLDRMALSMKNGWLDEENRVYIYYTLDDIQEDLGCAREKCAKVLAELDSKKGIGLIEKKRRGLGKPDIIYVKNFATIEAENEMETNEDADQESLGNADSSAEVRKSNFKKFEKRISRSSETELAEVRKSNANYTDIKYTDMSYINHINPELDMMVKTIKNNIEYEKYMSGSRDAPSIDHVDYKLFEELFQLICEVVCVKRESIRINGADYPYEAVCERFLQLNATHLEYVIDSLSKTATKITNIRAYLMTALFNAPATINSSITQEVRHDMFGGGWEEKGIV